jgi:hypothetical protein
MCLSNCTEVVTVLHKTSYTPHIVVRNTINIIGNNDMKTYTLNTTPRVDGSCCYLNGRVYIAGNGTRDTLVFDVVTSR